MLQLAQNWRIWKRKERAMENNQANEVRQKLTKTILVGLPAVGKTTLSKEIARLAEEKNRREIRNCFFRYGVPCRS